jgi:hypothetical protein
LQQQKNTTKDKDIKVKKICQEVEVVVQSKNSDKKYYEEQMANIYKKHFKFMSEDRRNNHNSRGVD